MDMRNKDATRILKGLIMAGTAALGLHSCASAYFYDVAVARKEKSFLNKSKDLDMKEYKDKENDNPEWLAANAAESPSIVSGDGLTLVAYWLPAKETTTNVVIIAHGYSGRSEHMTSVARFYRDRLGYSVLMPDARGHGRSGGGYIGFGWHERLDYLKWIEWVLARAGNGARISLHGVSMGGATVLMTSGETLPPQVRAIVSDCAYTSAHAELSWQLDRLYGIRSPALVKETSAFTMRKAGWSFEEASALDQVRKAKVPILFIHGDADSFVPFEMAGELYDACPSEKEFLVVKGAGHGLARKKDQALYDSAVEAFLAKHP